LLTIVTAVDIVRAPDNNGSAPKAIAATKMMRTLRGNREPSKFFIIALLTSEIGECFARAFMILKETLPGHP
jgi:hypothetical protein